MDNPFFHEFKKQASFFFKEKIKSARLVLTDVTPAQLLTEEVINGEAREGEARSMGVISRAAFEVDDYWRIVDILHKRLINLDRRSWRASYKAMMILEHLLTHGPVSVVEEFQSDADVIRELTSFQYVDDKGFNWGLKLRVRCERVLNLLEDGTFLKEERNKARKLTTGIKGFGSFCQRSKAADNGGFKEYVRSNSHHNDTQNHEEDEALGLKDSKSWLSDEDDDIFQKKRK